ncbi:tRNA (adenosine(37)-N6)-threonylcarbamoyltransferase complex dimerization subunit type 1 TsaB [Pseudanabaena sp. PCC 6802]|uniref:tRNA (adenosine(37)-N6)-threonylcarbamoyltransferase complex dimerization subunit type 1 TsaB n=1 Tax=Pseudanabaena sp. PCC 6802 TaxID=118173 RepID=UPI000346D4F5|nr:tRNA (adenosine(37)-N6)-threonylcarbamoyltransferase complex dimerization subunit type 1 TsaB [Pseudanabaena sp. PCC 6802]
MTLGLALHTTTEVLSMAIAELKGRPEDRDSLRVKQQSWQLGRDLSAQLHPLLAEFMQGYDWADLGAIAIAKGIGSFTGTRIGIVLARTLGEQMGIPVYAISCDEILERSQPLSEAPSPARVLLSIARERWQQKSYPHWSDALPLYSME